MANSSSARPAQPPESSASNTEPVAAGRTGPSLLWVLLLILPWGVLIAGNLYGDGKNCMENGWYAPEMRPYPDTLSYCEAHVRGLVWPTVLVVSTVVGVAAVISTAIILLIRRSRRACRPRGRWSAGGSTRPEYGTPQFVHRVSSNGHGLAERRTIAVH